mmetsp:Transcript_6195/g.14599  ORF Transcript_6195/g.14599 Transcript_6195/m.14599 type:complete len:319 (-) Transcript_6195:49-1005(-)
MRPCRGQWHLPPEQLVLQPGETEFDLDRVATELTVIISTSVSNFTPSTETPVGVLESLQANVALRWCRKLLVFDKVPSNEEIEELRQDAKTYHEVARGAKWAAAWNTKREAYEEYCATMRAMKEAKDPALHNVELIFLPRFGHLFGTVAEALEQVCTPFIFVTQHDLRLSGKFVAADVQGVLEALHKGAANYVNLNRDVNSSDRTRGYFRLLPDMSVKDEARRLSLTAVAGFSDQAHFARAKWYQMEVAGAIRPEERLTCMEHVLHEGWKDGGKWRGTFLYGGLDDGPFVIDLIYGLQVYDRGGKLLRLPPPPSRPAE